MFKLVGKKIFTILHSKCLFIKTYGIYTFGFSSLFSGHAPGVELCYIHYVILILQVQNQLDKLFENIKEGDKTTQINPAPVSLTFYVLIIGF